MPHFMFNGSYTTDALKSLVAKPVNREDTARTLCESLGATLVNAFLAMGKDDIVLIYEAPDDETAAAIALALASGGSIASGATTKLFTIAEAMSAMTKAQSATYAPVSG